jgi:hypothetical protein
VSEPPFESNGIKPLNVAPESLNFTVSKVTLMDTNLGTASLKDQTPLRVE